MQLITLLLQHPAQVAAGFKDSQGMTPAQIARKNSHSMAAALLTRQSVCAKA